MALHVEVVTLFPEMVRGALGFGVVGRAIERGLLSVGTEDPRAHTRMCTAPWTTGLTAAAPAWC